MPAQINRHDVVAWLRREGFVERTSGGHMTFEHPRSGVKIVVPGHGPNDLTKKVVGCIIRSLVRAGYDKGSVREALRTGEYAC